MIRLQHGSTICEMKPRSGSCSTLPLAARRHWLVGELDAVLTRLEVDLRRVVIACSGGADSTALLLAASVISDRSDQVQDSRPLVVYVHHHLRSEADQEAKDVATLSDRIGMPFRCVNIKPAEEKGSLAAAARSLRYSSLLEEASRVGAQAVLTAHHADDQLETVLMSLARGAGVAGISGMSQKRMLRSDRTEGIMLVRPLLHVTHQILCEYCSLAQVPWSEDASNLDPQSPRIRVRSEVTPVLESIWPGTSRRSSITAEVLEQAALALEEKVAHIFGPPEVTRWARSTLACHPRVLVGMGLQRAARHLGIAPDSVCQRQMLPAADAIRDDVDRPRQFDWEGGVEVHITAKEVWLSCIADGTH